MYNQQLINQKKISIKEYKEGIRKKELQIKTIEAGAVNRKLSPSEEQNIANQKDIANYRLKISTLEKDIERLENQ